MYGEDSFWTRTLNWVWTNWDDIERRLGRLRRWLRCERPEAPADSSPPPPILVIGPGGTGKTTLGRFLSGQMVMPLLSAPWEYQESLTRETFPLADDPKIELEVFPGQPRNRAVVWGDLRSELASGKYRGIVLTVAFGHHSFSTISYKHHELYRGNKDQFLADFLEASRAEEIRVLDYLRPALESLSGKLWVLVLVTKQDLWWSSRDEVRAFYADANGPWRTRFAAIEEANQSLKLRILTEYTSLVISNFVTDEGETLKKNVEGYDQQLQVDSQRRLLEALDGLRDWEG
jgi:hypothetical protein